MNFSILAPPRILFGRGTAGLAVAEALAFGARGIVVHGASAARADWLVAALRAGGAQVLTLAATGEPTLHD
ncbi:MAG: alcohol dehydrogenase, partial [Pseudorhodobacter sp.]